MTRNGFQQAFDQKSIKLSKLEPTIDMESVVAIQKAVVSCIKQF